MMDKYIDNNYEGEPYYKYSRKELLTPSRNGGEAVILKFHVFENEDGDTWSRGELKVQCYGNHFTIVDFNFDIDKLEALVKAQKKDE